ncbi:hypothetical protein FJ651_09720 [Paucihalobacter ruber]|uniref:Endonuclease/exonuclease/phosphatase domain-containing protein n=1 Tax=Paucihalobacter ruber TaxID=2567861 RepID=A0A506PMA9_9FLAO|nr:endonuclease/exonuclease/phosphatase family protein [Paucihalobacter ruber]TPV33360.1 hypothetical protein FJ651_09720 [Paucihalobacter ruber]
MNFHFTKIDKFLIVIQIILLAGIAGSFLDFGLISVFFSLSMPLIFVLSCMAALYLVLFKKYYFSLIGIVLFLFSFNFFYQFSKIDIDKTTNTVSLMTYNVRAYEHSVSKNIGAHASVSIAQFVDSISPDILILQESDYKRGRKITNYPYHFLGYRESIGKSLLEIYSKYEIIDKGYIDFPDTRNNAIYADIKIDEDTIRVYNLHLQSYVINRYIANTSYDNYNFWYNLNNVISKQIEQATLVKTHALKSNKKFIISGDFNATQFSKPYRLLKTGLNDSFISKGNGLGTTFSLKNYPLRLDYFLSHEQINILSHDNFDLNLSDHEPICVYFTIK